MLSSDSHDCVVFPDCDCLMVLDAELDAELFRQQAEQVRSHPPPIAM